MQSWKTHRCIERLLIVFLHGELKGNLRCAEKMGSTLFLWDYPFWFQSCVHRHVQNGDLTDGKWEPENRKINTHTELKLVSTVGQTVSGVCLGFASHSKTLICFVCSCAWLFVWGKFSSSWVFRSSEATSTIARPTSWWNIPMVAF